MRITIKNWKLALLTLFFFSLFIKLGFWQLSRAHQKEKLLQSFTKRGGKSPLTFKEMNSIKDLRFYRAKLTGQFDNLHTLLLDNKIFNGKVGYEVYTPFKAEGIETPILVDRGFIPLGKSRSELPGISSIIGRIEVSGMLNFPPTYVAFGKMNESQLSSPWRIEFINLPLLSQALHEPLFPYTLTLTPNHPAAFAIEWQIVTMGPERHRGYAIQWFAFALTLVVLFVALNRPNLKRCNPT